MSDQELLEQVFDPAVDHTPRIADLNQRNDPRKLSHYYKVSEYDAEVMGGPRTPALCGYLSKKGRADVGGYARAQRPENLMCPHCAVLYSMLPGRND